MPKVGIIGLSGSGKSKIFASVTNNVYKPFIDENNISIVKVIDSRLEYLRDLYLPKKYTPATFEFVDLKVKNTDTKGGMKESLSSIRETDAICIVINYFSKTTINSDLDEVLFELVFADYNLVLNRLEKLEKKLKAPDPQIKFEFDFLSRILPNLENGIRLDSKTLSPEELKIVKNYSLLSIKEAFVIINYSESLINKIDDDPTYIKFVEYANSLNLEVCPLCASIEYDLTELEGEDREFFKESYQISELSSKKVIEMAFKALKLSTYFTSGSDEVRAWIFKDKMNAKECAGIIHSDFERGFIKAETLAFNDLFLYKTVNAAKQAGKYRLEGKEYLVKDGDILLFKFNV